MTAAKVFRSTMKPAEDYPFCVAVKPVGILTPEQYLDVREIAPSLEFTKKWPPEHLRLAFQGNLHEIPEVDGEMLKGMIRWAAGATV